MMKLEDVIDELWEISVQLNVKLNNVKVIREYSKRHPRTKKVTNEI